MAAKKKKATKRATKAPAAPQAPPAPPQAPTYTCRKCGNHESVTQLRKVVVDIGWKLTQMHAIAPCLMCIKCGNTSVTVNANIGDLAGLVPEMAAPGMPTTVAECEQRIAELEAVQAKLAGQKPRKRAKKATKKKR